MLQTIDQFGGSLGVLAAESKCAFCGKRLKGRSINFVRLPDESQGRNMARLFYGRVPVCPRCGRTQPWAASLDQPTRATSSTLAPQADPSGAGNVRPSTPLIPILALGASGFSFAVALFLLVSRLGLRRHHARHRDAVADRRLRPEPQAAIAARRHLVDRLDSGLTTGSPSSMRTGAHFVHS